MVVAYEADDVEFDVDTEHLERVFGKELSPGDFVFNFAEWEEEVEADAENNN